MIRSMKSIIEERIGHKVRKLNKNEKHELGKIYYSGYWDQMYEVIDYKDKIDGWMGWSVTCKWWDGSITTHCTNLDYVHDYEVII